MVLIFVLGDVVVQIPMVILVAVMIMVSVGTFDWSSFQQPKKESENRFYCDDCYGRDGGVDS
ncbi:hypothetical protein ACEQPO_00620 [Bacillus sp. SL00103]